MTKEIFADIPNYPGYRISSRGYVQCCIKRGAQPPETKYSDPWRTLRFKWDNKGYVQVTLCNKSNKKTFRIHGLMGEVFLTKPISDKRLCVRHLDGDKQNNNLSNLAWGTYADNERDKLASGTYYSCNRTGLLDEAKVKEIRRLFEEERLSRKEIAQKFELNRSVIASVVARRTWSHI